LLQTPPHESKLSGWALTTNHAYPVACHDERIVLRTAISATRGQIMTALPNKMVLLDDPNNSPEDGPHMEFRLIYQGSLFADRGEPPQNQRDYRAPHKHNLRKAFHKQLKRLWEVTPFLQNPRQIRIGGSGGAEAHDIATLSAKHSHYGFHFVPLVTEDIKLLCGLDILFLRPDRPGKLWKGDIDNRIKTLIDSLRIPTANERYNDRTPEADETPFFCLLEDDKFITKLSVESDQLLDLVASENAMDNVRLVITVQLRPYEMHLGNMEFG
jgi:hypothetical protein